jgi:hypothetical protein
LRRDRRRRCYRIAYKTSKLQIINLGCRDTLEDRSYAGTGKYQTTQGIEEMSKSWHPSAMIPKMFNDRNLTESAILAKLPFKIELSEQGIEPNPGWTCTNHRTLADRSYEHTGKYQTGEDVQKLIAAWEPEAMLAQMFRDREITQGPSKEISRAPLTAPRARTSIRPQRRRQSKPAQSNVTRTLVDGRDSF